MGPAAMMTTRIRPSRWRQVSTSTLLPEQLAQEQVERQVRVDESGEVGLWVGKRGQRSAQAPVAA